MPATEGYVHVVDFWGDLACFTRPETNVERFSYPCPTPSAARGMLDSIFWDGAQFRWSVRRIEILRPVRRISLRRNEVMGVVPVPSVYRWMAGAEAEPLYADDAEDKTRGRTQRQTIALADVRCRVHAAIRPAPGSEGRIDAFNGQAGRRIRTGKCGRRPYLGCREFAAYFGPPDLASRPVDHDEVVGYMTYDLFDLDHWGAEPRQRTSVFPAAIRGGVMEVPRYSDASVLKGP